MSQTTALSANLISTLTGSDVFGSIAHSASIPLAIALADGTGLNQADKRWVSKARALAASTSENIDLAGVLTDVFGAAFTAVRVKMIYIALVTTTAGYTLEVGGAASNAFATMFGDPTDKLIVRAGGFQLGYAPDATAYAVTAGTGDILKINNPNAAGITYDIMVVAASV